VLYRRPNEPLADSNVRESNSRRVTPEAARHDRWLGEPPKIGLASPSNPRIGCYHGAHSAPLIERAYGVGMNADLIQLTPMLAATRGYLPFASCHAPDQNRSSEPGNSDISLGPQAANRPKHTKRRNNPDAICFEVFVPLSV
jgi:hypothetical protein